MGKEEDKKEINLMPEDMRSKESGFLSKMKSSNDFDFDFVSPKNSSLSKQNKTSLPFSARLKNIFSKPKRFGQPLVEGHKNKTLNLDKDGERPKIIYNPHENKPQISRDENTTIQLTNKTADIPKQDFKIPSKDRVSDDLQQIKIENTQPQITKKPAKPSFWDKFKKLFAAKPKVPKVPKVEKVPAHPIVARELEDIKPIVKKDELVDVLDPENIKSIPELKSSDAALPKVQLVAKEVIEEVKPIEHKNADFSIPAFNEQKNKKVISEKALEPEEDKKTIVQRFHQPQPRIRAKLLDNGGGVDLIPTSAKTRSWRQVINLLLVACLGSAFILGIFYGFLFYRAKNIEIQNANRSIQITSLEKQIVDYKDLNDKITDLGTEIKLVHKLLSWHFYWTNFFQLLEKYTISDVHYAGLTAGSGGALTLQATATDFDALARQIKVLEQDQAKEFVLLVDVSSAQYDEASGYVEFDMTLVLNPLLFVYNENYIYEIDNASSTPESGE